MPLLRIESPNDGEFTREIRLPQPDRNLWDSARLQALALHLVTTGMSGQTAVSVRQHAPGQLAVTCEDGRGAILVSTRDWRYFLGHAVTEAERRGLS